MVSPATSDLQHLEHPAWGWRGRRILAEYGAPADAPIPEMGIFSPDAPWSKAALTIWQNDKDHWAYEISVGLLLTLVEQLRELRKSLSAPEETS